MEREKKNAAAEIERLQERLGLVQQLGRLSLWERNLETGVGRWDPEIFRLFGLPPAPEAPAHEAASACIHPDDREKVSVAYLGSLAHPGRHEVRYRVPHADGRITWVHSVWLVPAQGRRVVGVIIDDSEAAELALERTAARVQRDLAAEVAGVGQWTWDLDRDVQHWNAAMLAMHGLPPGAPVPAAGDDRVSGAVLPEDRPALAAKMRDMLAPGAPIVEAHWRIRRADGRIRTLVGRARRLDEGPRRIVGAVLDITEMQATEQALRDKDIAEQANRAKSEFMSRMSHELRTPLNAVLGFADLLLADAAEPPQPRQRERLHHLRLAGRDLLALIDELLAIARMESSAGGAPRTEEARLDTAAVDSALQALLSRDSAFGDNLDPPESPPGPARYELVYVEDNPVNLLLVQQVVAQRPHLRLHAATTVGDGEALIRDLKPALVLVDLHLPDGDGVELLHRLRSGDDPVLCPCVVLSADAQPHQVDRALAAGFEAYWTKPIDIAGFLGALDARLSA